MKESSDNTNQPRKLEEVFRDGFEPAEVAPSAKLWRRIEQELEVKQAGYYKKHLAWYRGIAAASVLLLMLAMGYFWYDTKTAHRVAFRNSSVDTTAQNNNQDKLSASLPPSEKYAAATLDTANGKKDSDERVALTTTQPGPLSTPFKARTKLQSRASATNVKVKPSTVNRNMPGNKPAKLRRKQTEQNKLLKYPAGLGPTKDRSLVNENAIALRANKDSIDAGAFSDTTKQLARTLPPLLKADSLVTFTASATTGKATKRVKISRWAIGGGTGSHYFQQNIKFDDAASRSFANYSPQSAYNNTLAPISNNLAGNYIEAAKEEFNTNTQPAFSYRAVLAVNYKLNDKWSLEGGLTFTENQAQTSTSYIIYKRPGAFYNLANVKQNNNSFADKTNGGPANVTIPVTIFLAELTDNYLDNSNIMVDKVDSFTMYYRYRQVGVPVKLRYQKNQGRWFSYIQMGGAFNMLLQTSILSDSPRITNVEYTIGQPSPFRKWYVTALGSLGRGVKLSDVWQVQGSLDVARNFSALTQRLGPLENGKNKPYYLGFGLSTSYVVGRKTTAQN